MLESGEFGRLASAGDYASSSRTAQSERLANGKKEGENNRKNGNRYLAWGFAEAAVFAVWFHARIAAWATHWAAASGRTVLAQSVARRRGEGLPARRGKRARGGAPARAKRYRIGSHESLAAAVMAGAAARVKHRHSRAGGLDCP